MRPRRPSPAQRVLAAYRKGFTSRFGEPPAMDWAKNGAQAKRLVEQHGEPVVIQLLDEFFVSADPFILRSGYDFGVFCTSISRLIVDRAMGALSPAGRVTLAACTAFLARRRQGAE